MTTSGDTIYELSRNSIAAAMLRKVGALAAGQTASTEDLSNCQEALNGLIAQYQTLGMPLWKRSQYTLSMTATSTYTFGIGQTINIPFPLKVEGAILRRSSGSAQDMTPRSRQDFNLLNTTSTGSPVEYTYQPFVNYGILKIWPIPDTTTIANDTIELTYLKPLEGFTAASETSDFPQEWQLPLIYGGAVLIAPEYGLPLPDQQNLAKQAKTYLDIAVDWGGENASFFIQPERR